MLPEWAALHDGLAAWFKQLGAMAWPLAACSFITAAIAAERLVFTCRARLRREANFKKLAGDLLDHADLPKTLRDEVAMVALMSWRRALLSGVGGLRIVGTISPLLGLLGTILGIISAFQAIARQSGPVSPSLIADGLWEAMLTTAVGLSIALPALLLAYLFKNLGERELDDLRMRLNQMSLAIEIERSSQTADGSAPIVRRLRA